MRILSDDHGGQVFGVLVGLICFVLVKQPWQSPEEQSLPALMLGLVHHT